MPIHTITAHLMVRQVCKFTCWAESEAHAKAWLALQDDTGALDLDDYVYDEQADAADFYVDDTTDRTAQMRAGLMPDLEDEARIALLPLWNGAGRYEVALPAVTPALLLDACLGIFAPPADPAGTLVPLGHYSARNAASPLAVGA